jgi:hypothetical protein
MFSEGSYRLIALGILVVMRVTGSLASGYRHRGVGFPS